MPSQLRRKRIITSALKNAGGLSLLIIGCATLCLWLASCSYIIEIESGLLHIDIAGGDTSARVGGPPGNGFCASPPSSRSIELALGSFKLSMEPAESLRWFGTVPYIGRDLFGEYWRISIPLWLLLVIQVSVFWLLMARQRYKGESPEACAKCGYCLIGLSGRRCPECGLVIGVEKGGTKMVK